MMDYGTFLKKEHGNLSQKSHSYRKQTKFEGSTRQVRGALLKLFIQKPVLDLETIEKNLEHHDVSHTQQSLEQLVDEGFVVRDFKGRYSLKK
jgi:A/G-specific adenine glycosylase